VVDKFVTFILISELFYRLCALRAAGFEAEWLGPGTAHTSLHKGCSDPNHCPQHEADSAPLKWGAIKTNVGGNKAHKIWLGLGLVKKW